MIDIDDFKQFNDAYGHVTGDDVLRAVGRLMMLGLRRDIDVAARYGGEEFAIILPNTPAGAAHAVGERLRVTLSSSGAVLPSDAGDGAHPTGHVQPSVRRRRAGRSRSKTARDQAAIGSVTSTARPRSASVCVARSSAPPCSPTTESRSPA